MFPSWILSAAFILAASSTGLASDRTIAVDRGTPFPLVLENPFDTFLIDNPGVVDVHSRSDRSAIVEGLAPGIANIVFLDERSVAIANFKIVVCDARALRTDRQETDCEHP